MAKFIFVTGGVISGLGKGVVAASLGRLLKSRGYSVFVQKLDPYLNLDPGTMSPYEHGEIYVTQDGGETDLDLGHYERFIGTKFTKDSNYTSGKIYDKILERERNGFYKGKTVQIIPHVTNYIEEIISNAGKKSKADFVITEVGGTVGDIESQPFIFALSSFSNKNKNKCFFIHISYVPYLDASQEFKSKPTQNSIKELRQLGINPNMMILRSNIEIFDDIIQKTAFYSMIKKDLIVNLPNANSIYEVPLILEEKNVIQKIEKYFNFKIKKPKLNE
jgi:CTP synthase